MDQGDDQIIFWGKKFFVGLSGNKYGKDWQNGVEVAFVHVGEKEEGGKRDEESQVKKTVKIGFFKNSFEGIKGN